jgi:hypothetical protein
MRYHTNNAASLKNKKKIPSSTPPATLAPGMAPKRSAQPPPAESSMETDSGSDSDESEEEIAVSPPTVSSNKNMAPPPQKVQQPEPSDEEDEEDEEEEEDEAAEEEEEEEQHKVNYTAPPPASTHPPPPTPNRAESESDEEEETDDEAPPPKSVPKQEAVPNGGKPAPSSEDKKPAAFFQRSWSKDDEIRILETLAAHRREHGALPKPEVLEAALFGSLDNTSYGRKELMGKVTSLKSVYSKAVKGGKLPTKDHDRQIFDLSKEVWGGSDKPAGETVPSDFGEMCKMYPFLGEELKELERTEPGLYKRQFSLIGDDTAQDMDQKIKKQRMRDMKVELRRLELDREVIKMLMDLVQ